MWVQKQQQTRPNATLSVEQPAKLSLYEDPPESRVSLEEFESFAIDRLKGTLVSCYLPGIESECLLSYLDKWKPGNLF